MAESKAEKYKALHRRVTEELWNSGDTDAADSHLHPKLKTLRQAEGVDAAGLKVIVKRFRELMPDLKVKVEKQIVEGDELVTWTSITGTHTGEVAGIRATKQKVNLQGACLTRFQDGKVIEEHVLYDQADMAHQLGIDSPEGNLFTRLASA